MKTRSRSKGFTAEFRLTLRRGRQVWRLVPRRRKSALMGAGVIMGITSLCNTALPLLLGRLVDEVKLGTEKSLTAEVLYRTAAWFLGLISLAYLFREGLNV